MHLLPRHAGCGRARARGGGGWAGTLQGWATHGGGGGGTGLWTQVPRRARLSARGVEACFPCSPSPWLGPAVAITRQAEENRTLEHIMKKYVIGIGGVTNGGKTTLANSLHKQLPNCSMISQDDFFKPESEVEVDENGFYQYDVLDALYMEAMMKRVHSWIQHPEDLSNSSKDGMKKQNIQECPENICFLIIEGFLLYNYRPLNDVFNRRYFLTVPYDECKKRRSTRIYKPPDPPGYFDGHVWPMYLKNTREMENITKDIVYIDGLKSEKDICCQVYSDIMKALLGEDAKHKQRPESEQKD